MIITFLVGDPYKPSFATVTGRGDNPTFTAVNIDDGATHQRVLTFGCASTARMDMFFKKRSARFPCSNPSGVDLPSEMNEFLWMFGALQDDVWERIFKRQFVGVSKLTSSLQKLILQLFELLPIEAAMGQNYQT